MLIKGDSSTRVVTTFYFVTTYKDYHKGAGDELSEFLPVNCSFYQILAEDVLQVYKAEMEGMYFLDDTGVNFVRSMEGRYEFFRVLMMWEGVYGSGINTVNIPRGEDTTSPNIKTIRSVAQVLPRPFRRWWSFYTSRLARRGLL